MIGQIKSWIKFGMEILRSRRSLAIVAGMKKTNDHAEATQSNAKKELISLICMNGYFGYVKF